MTNAAEFDPTRQYRYVLRRHLMLGQEGRQVTFIMLNPSTADENANDPTVTRCIRFAQAWGFAMLEVVNLFGYRSTSPGKLGVIADPVGPENDFYITTSIWGADQVVCAWGNNGALHGRSARVKELLAFSGRELVHLGLTAGGEPRHPLYVRADQPRRRWEEVALSLQRVSR